MGGDRRDDQSPWRTPILPVSVKANLGCFAVSCWILPGSPCCDDIPAPRTTTSVTAVKIFERSFRRITALLCCCLLTYEMRAMSSAAPCDLDGLSDCPGLSDFSDILSTQLTYFGALNGGSGQINSGFWRSAFGKAQTENEGVRECGNAWALPALRQRLTAGCLLSSTLRSSRCSVLSWEIRAKAEPGRILRTWGRS